MPRSGKTASTPQGLVPDEDRSGPKPAFDPEAYNVVARAAKLRHIALFQSHFTVESGYFSARRSENPPRPRYAGEFGTHHFDASDGQAGCEWKWAITLTHERKKLLSIEVVYLIAYDGLKDCDEQQVVRFLRRVGRFATYPYFRAHVSQLNWEARLDLPILPTIAT